MSGPAVPADLLAQRPMLASGCAEPLRRLARLDAAGAHVFDVKWDGVRALAYRLRGGVRLVNRSGRDVTGRYPDVADALSALEAPLALDGELVAFDADGRPDFAALARRDRQTTPAGIACAAQRTPVAYVAFDLLYTAGVDLRDARLEDRLAQLRSRLQGVDLGGRVRCSVAGRDGAELWRLIEANRLEGLIAKRADSRYRAGRSPAWVKLKRARRLLALAIGAEPGQGARESTFGALRLGLLDGYTVVAVGRVGGGFDDRRLAQIRGLLDAGRPFVVEVAYAELTPGRRLRFPTFIALRPDAEAADCTIAQLEVRR